MNNKVNAETRNRAVLLLLSIALIFSCMGWCSGDPSNPRVTLESWWMTWTHMGGTGTEADAEYATQVAHLGSIGATAVSLYLHYWYTNPPMRERLRVRMNAIKAARIPVVIVMDTTLGRGYETTTAPYIGDLHPTDPKYPAAAAKFVEDATALLAIELPGVKPVFYLADEARRARLPGEPEGKYYLRAGERDNVNLIVTVADAILARCPDAVLVAAGYPWPELRSRVKVWNVPEEYKVDSMVTNLGYCLGYWNTVSLPFAPVRSPTQDGIIKLRTWLVKVGAKGWLAYRYDKTAADLWGELNR